MFQTTQNRNNYCTAGKPASALSAHMPQMPVQTTKFFSNAKPINIPFPQVMHQGRQMSKCRKSRFQIQKAENINKRQS